MPWRPKTKSNLGRCFVITRVAYERLDAAEFNRACTVAGMGSAYDGFVPMVRPQSPGTVTHYCLPAPLNQYQRDVLVDLLGVASERSAATHAQAFSDVESEFQIQRQLPSFDELATPGPAPRDDARRTIR